MECVIAGMFEWKNEKRFLIILCALNEYVVND